MIKKNSILDILEKRNFRLFYDILHFAASNLDGGFRLTELGNWLLDNNPEFIEKFSNSHTKRSYRLMEKRSVITNRLEDLVELRLIEKIDLQKSRKNNTHTPIYSMTDYGSIVWNLMEVMTSNKENRAEYTEKLFDNISLHIRKHKSSVSGFFVKFFENCKQEKALDKLEIEPRLFLYWNPMNKGMQNLFKYFMSNVTARRVTGRIFMKTLDELDDEQRKLVCFQIKLNIESGYEAMPVTLEWEKMRFDNIKDHTKLTLLGSCSNCKCEYPFQMDLLDFHTLPRTISYIVDPRIDVKTRRIKCEKCGKPDGLGIVPIWQYPNEPTFYYHITGSNISFLTA